MLINPESQPPSQVEIRIAGRLSPEWAGWFGRLVIRVERSGEGSAQTVLTGPVSDQAELFGILNRIRDLGLRLISVNPCKAAQEQKIHRS